MLGSAREGSGRMSNKMRVAVSVAGVVCVLLALALWSREGKAPA